MSKVILTKEKLIEALENCNSMREVSEYLGISETTLFRRCKEFEIDYKKYFSKNRLKVTKEMVLEAQSRTNSAAEAARMLNIPFSTYKRIAEKFGIYETNQGLKGGHKKQNPEIDRCKFSVDNTVFDKITPESAYWLGFLAADGTVTKKYISLTLQIKDYGQLEKYKKFLKATYEIKKYNSTAKGKEYPNCRLQITDKLLTKKLEGFGIVENKSNKEIDYLEKIPEKNKIYFIYGYLDGDGSIFFKKYVKYKDKKIEILGNKILIDSFSEYLNKNNISNNIYFIKKTKYPKYRLVISKSIDIEKFLKEYLNLPFVLERKREKAKEILKNI